MSSWAHTLPFGLHVQQVKAPLAKKSSEEGNAFVSILVPKPSLGKA
jgi:uncharacterized protein YwlG (UPF0340 family)